MKVSGASNSVLVKARAMYARRLTEQDCTAMLAMAGTAELIEYLKNKTDYSDALRGFSTTAPYRGQLNSLLHSRLTDEFAVLCRYEKSTGLKIYEYFIAHNDCLQILQRLRTLGEEIDESYIPVLSPETKQLSRLDLSRLSAAKTVGDVLGCLDSTEYRQLVAKSDSDAFMRENLVFVEAEMNNYCCKKLKELIKSDCSGSAKSELLETIGFCKDMESIVRIYRLKKLVNAPPAQLGRFVVPGLTRLGGKELESIIAADSCETMAKAVLKTQYARIFSGGGDPEAAANRMIAEKVRKRFRFTKSAAEALWCFVMLRELEINDITNLFEGARCRVQPEYIKQYVYCFNL